MLLSQLDFIRHILDEVLFIQYAMKGKSLEDIEVDLILQKAIIRILEVIGEATKKVDFKFRERYPGVDWKAMAGTRDKLIHNYFEVDLEIVFSIISDNLPGLKHQLQSIIENEEGSKQ